MPVTGTSALVRLAPQIASVSLPGLDYVGKWYPLRPSQIFEAFQEQEARQGP